MKSVRFKRFVFGEGYTWDAGGEGKVIAETNSHYKVKTSWLSSEWVYKNECEEITYTMCTPDGNKIHPISHLRPSKNKE